MLDELPARQDSDETTSDTRTAPDDALYCATCGLMLTRQRWAISPREAHEHVVFNPAGRLFRVRCFSRAPGGLPLGPPSGAFTWFPGLLWRVALCRGCDRHIGWKYDSRAGQEGFWGLDAAALRSTPRSSD